MKLLLIPRHLSPTVAGGWVAHVGSSNERPGMTGIAHLFEHMMFKGTPTIGTKNYQRDLEIISEQEKLRDRMREEEAKMRAAWSIHEFWWTAACTPSQMPTSSTGATACVTCASLT